MYKGASRNQQAHLMRGVRFRRSSEPLIRHYAKSIEPAIEWPISVSDGEDPDCPGALLVRTFASREEADAAGFGWIGRLASGA